MVDLLLLGIMVWGVQRYCRNVQHSHIYRGRNTSSNLLYNTGDFISEKATTVKYRIHCRTMYVGQNLPVTVLIRPYSLKLCDCLFPLQSLELFDCIFRLQSLEPFDYSFRSYSSELCGFIFRPQSPCVIVYFDDRAFVLQYIYSYQVLFPQFLTETYS